MLEFAADFASRVRYLLLVPVISSVLLSDLSFFCISGSINIVKKMTRIKISSLFLKWQFSANSFKFP